MTVAVEACQLLSWTFTVDQVTVSLFYYFTTVIWLNLPLPTFAVEQSSSMLFDSDIGFSLSRAVSMGSGCSSSGSGSSAGEGGGEGGGGQAVQYIDLPWNGRDKGGANGLFGAPVHADAPGSGSGSGSGAAKLSGAGGVSGAGAGSPASAMTPSMTYTRLPPAAERAAAAAAKAAAATGAAAGAYTARLLRSLSPQKPSPQKGEDGGGGCGGGGDGAGDGGQNASGGAVPAVRRPPPPLTPPPGASYTHTHAHGPIKRRLVDRRHGRSAGRAVDRRGLQEPRQQAAAGARPGYLGPRAAGGSFHFYYYDSA